MSRADQEIILHRIRDKWPKTWRLVKIDVGRPFHWLYALSRVYVIVPSEVEYDRLNFEEMDWFEQNFDKICQNVANNDWIPCDFRTQYPNITRRIEVPRTFLFHDIKFNNSLMLHVCIAGRSFNLHSNKVIVVDGSVYLNGNLSDDPYSCMKDLENFLAEVEKEQCCKEIIALLPQPIAEEIVEQF